MKIRDTGSLLTALSVNEARREWLTGKAEEDGRFWGQPWLVCKGLFFDGFDEASK